MLHQVGRKMELSLDQANDMARPIKISCKRSFEDLKQIYSGLKIGSSCPMGWKWFVPDTSSVSSEIYLDSSSSTNDRPDSRASSESSNAARGRRIRTTRSATTRPKQKATPKTTKTKTEINQKSLPTRKGRPRLAPIKKTDNSSKAQDKSSDLKPGTLGSRQQVTSSAKLQLPTKLVEKQLSFKNTSPALDLIDTNNFVDESMVCFPKEFCQRAGIKEVPADVYSLCRRIKISVVDIELN